MITRYAEKEDLPQVYVMYLAGLSELQDKIAEVNEQKALNHVLECWSQAPCILLEKDGEIIGFAGLKTASIPYSDMVLLREYMFYIHPDHRGLKAWRLMCKAVQEVADKFNLNFVGEHLLQGSIQHHERLIRMAGAKPTAIASLYEVKNGRW